MDRQNPTSVKNNGIRISKQLCLKFCLWITYVPVLSAAGIVLDPVMSVSDEIVAEAARMMTVIIINSNAGFPFFGLRHAVELYKKQYKENEGFDVSPSFCAQDCLC